MGRLFWKFFFMFWLAQLATGAGIAALIFLLVHLHAGGLPPPPFAPMPDLQQGIAAPGPRALLPHLPPIAVPMVAGSVVSLVFAALMAWYFSKPIRSLGRAFAASAEGALEMRLAPEMGRRRDELTDLGRAFDGMARRLQDLMQGQRQLLHDVSHELRSPLARVQAAVGLARQQPERTLELMERIERESIRIDALVSDLLTLSRVEADMAGVATEVAFDDLVAEVVDDAGVEAEQAGCMLDFAAGVGTTVASRAGLLYSAIENVLRNAIRHSPAGATVAIETLFRPDTAQVCVVVSDQGPGVPPADLPSLFEPFFRSGTSACADGHGLGLAITGRIVEVHGGEIDIGNVPGAGLRVTIRLPAARQGTRT